MAKVVYYYCWLLIRKRRLVFIPMTSLGENGAIPTDRMIIGEAVDFQIESVFFASGFSERLAIVGLFRLNDTHPRAKIHS